MDLQQFEPSSCRCDSCRQTCRVKPGFCAPGDVERIAGHVGVEDVRQFAVDNFDACDGLTIPFGNEKFVVPVIVPKQREDGRCVFLTADERCSVHPVKPFGCSRCNACEGGNAAANNAIMEAIALDDEYLYRWNEIAFAGIDL